MPNSNPSDFPVPLARWRGRSNTEALPFRVRHGGYAAQDVRALSDCRTDPLLHEPRRVLEGTTRCTKLGTKHRVRDEGAPAGDIGSERSPYVRAGRPPIYAKAACVRLEQFRPWWLLPGPARNQRRRRYSCAPMLDPVLLLAARSRLDGRPSQKSNGSGWKKCYPTSSPQRVVSACWRRRCGPRCSSTKTWSWRARHSPRPSCPTSPQEGSSVESRTT